MAIDSLFWRQVVGCAEHLVVVLHGERCIGFFSEQSQAEIENFYDPLFIDKDIGWLNIAVYQARFVGMVKPTRGLCDVVGCNSKWQRPMLTHQGLQVCAVDIFHYDVMSIFFVVDIERMNDVRVIQGSDGFGLALKSFKVAIVTKLRFRKHLNGSLVLHH